MTAPSAKNSLIMKAMAAADVWSAGRPERAKARKSNQRYSSDLRGTFAAASTREKGPDGSMPLSSSSAPKRAISLGSSFGKYLSSALWTAPTSARSAMGGTPPTTSASGLMASSRAHHSSSVAAPPKRESSLPKARLLPERTPNWPSGMYIFQLSYVAHSGDSPTASSTCRKGLSEGAEHPEKSEGPESKWKVPAEVRRVNP
mmetsp:Transcript_9727/g.16137  ORF Transcript_9727/g.16137 Transcript_9727/m.16137 type:complete len:202 (-) Transcript_9727:254-859(-)